MTISRDALHDAAKRFCAQFAAGADAETLLSLFSTKHPITAIEHGEPALAPFLGRLFEGRQGVMKYLEIIGMLLEYEDISFSEYVVDTETLKVSVKGRGTFRWIGTGESWDETFAYVLDFDEELKVIRYQIWADSGAAYLSQVGRLSEVKRGPIHVAA